MTSFSASRRYHRRTILLVVAGLVAGAALVQPVAAHITSNLRHLYRHLDPRYLPGGTLPSGSTIRGHYANYGRSDGANIFIAGHDISFSHALASDPTPEVILAGATSTTNCPGTADNPSAAPGYLCVYEHDSQNKRDTSFPFVGYGNSGPRANRFGTHIYTQSNDTAAGFFWSRGTWAVTAP